MDPSGYCHRKLCFRVRSSRFEVRNMNFGFLPPHPQNRTGSSTLYVLTRNASFTRSTSLCFFLLVHTNPLAQGLGFSNRFRFACPQAFRLAQRFPFPFCLFPFPFPLDQALDLLVSSSSIRYRTSTDDLSTLSSSRGLTSLCCGNSFLQGGFTLRCLQRLSRPHFASQLCHWHDNCCTRGASIPVLSY